LMQLMPATADRYAVVDPYSPDENIGAGTIYLRWLLDEFGGELELALAGYNAGPTAVRQFGGIPPYPETMTYVERVLRIYLDEPDYSLDGSRQVRLGRKTYLVRDASGQLVMTTTPPAAD
ncbi:MAG: lytic transglycosylase domain-containing protein, partial [Acidobacteria bacterium]